MTDPQGYTYKVSVYEKKSLRMENDVDRKGTTVCLELLEGYLKEERTLTADNTTRQQSNPEGV